MSSAVEQRLQDRALVAAITHDVTRVWLLHEESTEPVMVIRRPGVTHMHARAGQERHGHASETSETPYFIEVARVLDLGSNVLLLGHGTGRSNTMERFLDHLGKHHVALLDRVVASGNVNIPALSDQQLVNDARHRWPEG
jgi:hypothetical protein